MLHHSQIGQNVYIHTIYICIHIDNFLFSLQVWGLLMLAPMILYIHKQMKVWCHVSRKISSRVVVIGEGSAAGKERLVSEPTFHPLSKCNMKPTNIHSDWMFNAFSGLCINYITQIIYFTFVRHFSILCCCWVSTLDSTVCWLTDVP